MDEPTHARRRLAPHPIADSVHEVPTGVEVPIKTFFIEVQLKQTEAVQVIKAMKTVMAAKPFATKPKQRLRPGVGGPGSQEEEMHFLSGTALVWKSRTSAKAMDF